MYVPKGGAMVPGGYESNEISRYPAQSLVPRTTVSVVTPLVHSSSGSSMRLHLESWRISCAEALSTTS